MSNICSNCGKEYDYAVKVFTNPNGEKVCVHDSAVKSEQYFTEHEKKIKKNLPNHQFMVKGKDGLTRILEKG